jgi:hypothetical protein
MKGPHLIAWLAAISLGTIGWSAQPVCPGVAGSLVIDEPGGISAMAVGDGLAVTVDSYGLSTWDISNAAFPNRLGSYVFPRGSHPGLYSLLFDVFVDPLTKWACVLPTFACYDLREPTRPKPFDWGPPERPNFYDEYGSHVDSGIAVGGSLIAARHKTGPNFDSVWMMDLSTPGPRSWTQPAAFDKSFNWVIDLEIVGDLLLVIDRTGWLGVWDISDLQHPVLRSHTNLESGPSHQGRVSGGNTVAFVQIESGGVDLNRVVDLSHPGEPLVHRIPYDLDWYLVENAILDGDDGVAHISRWSDGVLTSFIEEVDFSSPDSPEITSSREADPSEIALTPDHVLTTPNRSRLRVYRRHRDLEVVGESSSSGSAGEMEVSRSLGVVANGWGGILTLDLTDSANPTVVGRLDLNAHVRAVELRGQTAIVLSQDALWTVDCSNWQDPTVMDTITVDGGSHLLALESDTAVVASHLASNYGEYTVYFIDVSDPFRLEHRSQIQVQPDPYGSISDLAAAGGHVYAIAGWLLVAIDISDPDDPVQSSEIHTRTSPGFNFIEPIGDSLVMTSFEKVEIVDVTNPQSMAVVREYDDLNGSYVETAGGGLLAIAGSSGTYLADFRNLEDVKTYPSPVEIRSWSSGVIIGERWLRPSGYAIDLISLECRPPEAEFEVSGAGPTIWFEDLSLYQVTERTWDFGDGATSDQLNPVHTYAAPGHYTVSLTVSSPNGTDSTVETIEVGPGRSRHAPANRHR